MQRPRGMQERMTRSTNPKTSEWLEIEDMQRNSRLDRKTGARSQGPWTPPGRHWAATGHVSVGRAMSR